MKTFHIDILSPERVFYTGECASLVLPIGDGYIGIMAGRSPMTAAIASGEASFVKPDGERISCAVSQGIVDVTKNGVKLLCESVLLPSEIDEAKERETAEIARAEMSKKQSYTNYRLSQLTFAKAMNNLRVKKHSEINM